MGVDGSQLPLVGDVDLRELGVRPALVVTTHDVLPQYVTRDCDNALRRALRAGGLVVVEGPARSGRTRTALNAIHTTLDRRKLLTPRNHREIEELVHAGPIAGSVVWLDDAERFDEPDIRLIREICMPQRLDVVVVATAQTGTELSGIATSTVSIGKELSGNELDAAQRLQDDPRIMAALFGQQSVRLAEDVAAGPLLRDRWRRDGDDLLGATGNAVVSVALQVYLAGYRDGVPAAVLEELHRQFLPESVRYNPGIPAFAEALKWACTPVYGFSSLLVAERDNRYRPCRQLAYWLADQPDRPKVSDAIWKAVLELASGRECRGVGLEAYEAKRYDVAERAMRRAISESDADDSWVAVTSNDLGAVLAAVGRYVEAEQAFGRAAQGGRLPEAMVNLAKILAERDDVAGAEGWLRKAAGLGYTGAMSELVGLLAARGDREAMTWCEIALRAGDAMPTFRLAHFYVEEGDLANAEVLLRQAAHLNDPVAWFNLGQVLNQRQELGQAREFYRMAADAGHGPSFTALGTLAEDAGDLEEAQRHYRRGVAAADPGAMRELGNLLLRLDDEDEHDGEERRVEACELLERASDLGDERANIYLAGLLYSVGRSHAAGQRLQRAADMGFAPAMLLLGEHYQQQGDDERARQWVAAGTSALGDVDRAAHIRSMFHESLYASAENDQTLPVEKADSWVAVARWLISHRGEIARSERACREAIEAGDDSALMDLAILLILRGELAEAFAVVQRASGVGDPDGLAVHAALVMTSGDEIAAERIIDQVGDPDHPMVGILKLLMSARRDDEAGVEEWISRISQPMPKVIRADTHRDALASVQLRLEPGLTLSNVDLAAVWFLGGLSDWTEASSGAVLTFEHYRRLVDNDMPLVVGQLLDEVLALLAERGLINVGTPAPDLAVTDLGTQAVTDRRRQLRDPVARRYACRQAILLWLYAAEVTSGRSLVSARIHETSLGFIHGDEFTEEEVHNSVAYLEQQGLLTTHGESWRMTISADGSDCVERYQASITKFLESRMMSGQNVSIGGHNYGNASAVGTGNAMQKQENSSGADAAELLKALQGIRVVIPHLELDQADAAELEKAIDEVEQAGNELTPARSRVLLQGMKAILDGSTSALAAGLAATIEKLISGLIG
jgi:tetratricopeptide (TPR) repeat protein